MNFPDVPMDEKLFESNEMMREYWDRSTRSREIDLPEAPFEAQVDADDDLVDLRNFTALHYDKPVAKENAVPEQTEVIEGVVKPKAMSTDATWTWILLIAFGIFIFFALTKRDKLRV